MVFYFFSELDDGLFFDGEFGRQGFFSSKLLLSSVMLEAPRPIAFRLRGQDPLLILALGDLQWARGPLLSVSFSLLLDHVLLSSGCGKGSLLPPSCR